MFLTALAVVEPKRDTKHTKKKRPRQNGYKDLFSGACNRPPPPPHAHPPTPLESQTKKMRLGSIVLKKEQTMWGDTPHRLRSVGRHVHTHPAQPSGASRLYPPEATRAKTKEKKVT